MLFSSSLLITFKVTSALAKEMVHSETAKEVVPSIFHAGRQWILEKITNNQLVSDQTTGEEENAARKRELQEKHEAESSTEYLVYHWLEAIFAWFQVIVLWHEPFVSICALSGLLTCFLFLTYFAPRFYATIMIALYIYNASKYWFRYVWPTIRVPPGNEREEEMRLDVDRFTYLHPQLMTLAELGHFIRNLMQISELCLKKLLKVRRERPVYFCSYICSILSVTAYIGNRISGVSLLFFSAVAIVSAPGIYLHLLPDRMKHWLKQSIGLRIINQLNELSHEQQEAPAESTSSPLPSTAPLLSILKRSPETIKQEASQSLLSFSTAAKSIETQALTILEHFKRRSFSGGPETAATTGSSTGGDGAKPATSGGCSETSQRPEVSDDAASSTKSHPHESNRRSSDDVSSNDSVSLIDSDDDDGEGGFVML